MYFSRLDAGAPDNEARAWLWDPSKPLGDPTALREVNPPIDPDTGKPVNIWCAGQSLLADGQVLVTGGNLAYEASGQGNWRGLNRIYTFDPWSEQWTEQPRMAHGRWYPTQTLLPDGRTLITSGRDETGNASNAMNLDIELFNPPATRGGQGTLTKVGQYGSALGGIAGQADLLPALVRDAERQHPQHGPDPRGVMGAELRRRDDDLGRPAAVQAHPPLRHRRAAAGQPDGLHARIADRRLRLARNRGRARHRGREGSDAVHRDLRRVKAHDGSRAGPRHGSGARASQHRAAARRLDGQRRRRLRQPQQRPAPRRSRAPADRALEPGHQRLAARSCAGLQACVPLDRRAVARRTGHLGRRRPRSHQDPTRRTDVAEIYEPPYLFAPGPRPAITSRRRASAGTSPSTSGPAARSHARS